MRLVFFLGFIAACSTDTFTSDDASTDADASGDGATCPSICAGSGAALCADFDEGTSWTSLLATNTGGNGTIATTTARAVSCSTSLEATVPPVLGNTLDGGVTNHALATHVFNLTIPHLVVELDLNLPTASGGGTFFSIRPDADTLSGVSIESTNTAWLFAVRNGGTNANDSKVITPVANGWTHMKLDVTLGLSGTAVAVLAYGPEGTTPTVVTLTADSTKDTKVTTATVNLGIGGIGATWTQPVVADYDNVVVTLP